MKNSLGHPQGDKLIRKEDHAGIIDCYISRVENGKFEVKRRIPKEDLQQEHAAAAQPLDAAGVVIAVAAPRAPPLCLLVSLHREHPDRAALRHVRILAGEEQVHARLHLRRIDAPAGLDRDVLLAVDLE